MGEQGGMAFNGGHGMARDGCAGRKSHRMVRAPDGTPSAEAAAAG